MTHSSELDNLPLLTEVIALPPVDDLPTLTEVVDPASSSVQEYIKTLSSDESRLVSETEPPVIIPSVEVSASPAQFAMNTAVEPIHPLTLNPANAIAERLTTSPRLTAELSEEQWQQLLNKLQQRLEGKFMQQLAPQIAQLQKQVFEQALSELKNELPALLRNVLTVTESDK